MALSTSSKDVIQLSLEVVNELDELWDTEDIIVIGQKCNKLSTLSVNVGRLVSDADKLFNSLKDDYEYSFEKKKLELIEAGQGVSKAESMSKVANFDKKVDYRKAEDGFERLRRFLSRVDRVLDAYKQFAATLKMSNLKNV